MNFTVKKLSISKWLSEKYGGEWKYDGRATWWCNDDKRHASRVASGRDMEGEYTGHWRICLYSEDKAEWLPFSGNSEVDL